MTIKTHGPDFLALQVRDLERAADFYEEHFGLARLPRTPPGVIAFGSDTIPFALREPLPGTDLDAGPLGLGVSVSLKVSDADAVHATIAAAGRPIAMEPFDTPYGRTFVFVDPEGYQVAVHGARPDPESAD